MTRLRSYWTLNNLFILISFGVWLISIFVVTSYFFKTDFLILPERFSSTTQPQLLIPFSCLDHYDPRSHLLISISAGDDLDQTYHSVDSVLRSAPEDHRLQIAIHIPYRLRKQKYELKSHYSRLIRSGRIWLYINPREPLQPPSHSYVNTTWRHRQRTLDFSYTAQIAADRSQLFIPLAAGILVNNTTIDLVDDITHSVESLTNQRWSTINFLPVVSLETSPAFSGLLFNSSELMRISMALKTYRAARPAEEILSLVTSSLMIESKVIDRINDKLFIDNTRLDVISHDTVVDDAEEDDVQLKETDWNCLPGLQPSDNSSSLPVHQYRYAFAIPTSYRSKNKSFLIPLLDQLFDQITSAEPDSVVIVMFMTGGEWQSRMRLELEVLFNQHIASRRLRLHSAPELTYPTLQGLRENYGDSPARVRWRSKQNLDYASLIEVCRGLADIFIMMEDDVKLTDDFVQGLGHAVMKAEEENPAWTMIDVCFDIGFAGKLFHDHSLWGLQVLLWTFYDELPCDFTYHISIALESGHKYTLPYLLLEHRGKGSSTLDEKNVPEST